MHTAPDLQGIPETERAVVARLLPGDTVNRRSGWPTCRAFVHALIVAAREDDRRTTDPAGNAPGPSAVGATKLPETQVPPPIPPTRAAGETSSRVAAGATDGWLPRAVLAGLAVVLVVLVALVVIPRVGPSGDRNVRGTPPVEPTPVSAPTPKLITNSIGMKLVLIPPGEFAMGSPSSDKGAEADEKPQHLVRITRPLSLGATEVTQGQYRAVTGQSPSYSKGSDDLPVEQDSVASAARGLTSNGGRIPVRRSGP